MVMWVIVLLAYNCPVQAIVKAFGFDERTVRNWWERAGIINTAFIERFNATCRSRLSWLSRRTRHLAQQPATLTAGMYDTGCFYNLCDPHRALRRCLSMGTFAHHCRRWLNQPHLDSR